MTLSITLRNKIREKLGRVSNQTLYVSIRKKAREQHTTDHDLALLLIAIDLDIDVRKRQFNVPPYKLELLENHIQQSHRIPVGSPPEWGQVTRGKKRKQKTHLLSFSSDLQIVDNLLPEQLLNEAEKMARVYPMTYVFENSVRNYVRGKLEKYGPNWFDLKSNNKIKQKVRERIEKEKKNKWHGKRNLHPIFYTDMEELATVIAANYSDFADDFPNPNWATSKIEEVTMSRNAIAHHNPLEQDDIDRLRVNLRDWIKQISSPMAT